QQWRQVLACPATANAARLADAWRGVGHWLPLAGTPPLAMRRQEPPMYRRQAATFAGGPALPDLAPRAGPRHGLEEGIDPSSRAIAQRFAPAGKEPTRPSLGAQVVAPPPAATRLPTAELGAAANPAAYRCPPLGILKRPPPTPASDQLTQSARIGHARLLGDVLADFGVKGEIKAVHPGPVVTLFEFEPARGTKASPVIVLAEANAP